VSHDTDYGGESDMLTDILGSIGGVVLAFLAVYLIVAFVLIYFAADRQGRTEGARDPALGARVMTSFLLTLAGQVVVAGLAILGAAMVEGGDGSKMAAKVALGLILGGGLACGLPLALRRRIAALSAGARDLVSRKAWGVNAIIAGLASAAGLIGCMTSLVATEHVGVSIVLATLVYTGGAVVAALQVTKPDGTTPTA
jgi:hypothetical protein